MNKTVLHSGKCGDCISSLAALYELNKRDGTKFDFLLNSTGDVRLGGCSEDTLRQVGGKPMAFNRSACEFIKPLLEVQPYINSVQIVDGQSEIPNIDLNLDEMRAQFLDQKAIEATNTNLELMYKCRVGLPIEHTEQWLFNVTPKTPPRLIVLARSTRYLSAHLWLASRAEVFRNHGCFIGTDFEHSVFEDAFDTKIEHVKVKDALEAAQYISGSSAFIAPGNLHYWIACGVGHTNVINELCLDVWTTYYRNNPRVKYIQGGRCFT